MERLKNKIEVFFIIKYLMAMEHSLGEGHEDKPHEVKDGKIEAAIVGASSEAGKKVPQLTQPTRAPKGKQKKSTAQQPKEAPAE